MSRGVVEAIGEAVSPPPGQSIVEIGPGVGTLTGELLRRGAEVVAIEKDRRMLDVLRDELAGHKLRLVDGDATKLDLAALEITLPTIVCGNLPYAITGAILRRLVEQRDRIARAVIMIQREVRDRLVAEPGSKAYGAPSVFVNAAFEVHRVLSVKPGSFHPPPKVESAVVCLVPLAQPRAEETPAFRSVVRAAFEQRRKTLRRALASLGPAAAESLSTAGIDGTRRGETLSVEEFDELAREYERLSSG